MDKRECFICSGTGIAEGYGEKDDNCYLCNGTGLIEDTCYCSSRCTCECDCGYEDGTTCNCYE